MQIEIARREQPSPACPARGLLRAPGYQIFTKRCFCSPLCQTGLPCAPGRRRRPARSSAGATCASRARRWSISQITDRLAPVRHRRRGAQFSLGEAPPACRRRKALLPEIDAGEASGPAGRLTLARSAPRKKPIERNRNRYWQASPLSPSPRQLPCGTCSAPAHEASASLWHPGPRGPQRVAPRVARATKVPMRQNGPRKPTTVRTTGFFAGWKPITARTTVRKPKKNNHATNHSAPRPRKKNNHSFGHSLHKKITVWGTKSQFSSQFEARNHSFGHA